MVKAKQKNLRVFEIRTDDSEELAKYLEKNAPLFRDFLLLFPDAVEEIIATRLGELGLCYLEENRCQGRLRISASSEAKTSEPATTQEASPQLSINQNQVSAGAVTPPVATRIIDRPVRSGEEVVHEGTLVIFGRINSGAKVICSGDVHLYGEVNGVVECQGDLLVAKQIGSGSVVLQGELLDSQLFDGNLKAATIRGEKTEIRDL